MCAFGKYHIITHACLILPKQTIFVSLTPSDFKIEYRLRKIGRATGVGSSSLYSKVS